MKHLKSVLILIIIFVHCTITLLFTACKEPVELQPNIVLVLADDLGVPQVGCYGSSFYLTPNIDRFAEKGARFTQAYSAAAVCSPTRSAIFTGKHPARTHITDFIAGNNDSGYPLLQPEWQKFLLLKETTIAEILKQEGYYTALFGKWHLSKQKSPPGSQDHGPEKQGFDESFITYKPARNLPIGPWQSAEEDAHSVDTLTNLAIDFMHRYKNAPFFLVVSHNTIHDPIMERETSIEKYTNHPDAGREENNPVIAAMVERLDDSFGRIIKAIKDLQLEENTLIIFYSDNGAQESYAKQTPFRKGKGWLYEGGIRVPLIMKWKGKIEENTTCNLPVTSMDLFMTIRELTTEQINDDVDGKNLLSLLNSSARDFHRNMFWNYPHYHKGTGMKPGCAIRSGDFKLIKWYEPYLLGEEGVFELYDLKNDIGESNNLAQQMPEKTSELDLLLEQWKTETGAQEPSINRNKK